MGHNTHEDSFHVGGFLLNSFIYIKYIISERVLLFVYVTAIHTRVYIYS